MNVPLNLTEKIRRFDNPVGTSIGSLARFHPMNTTDMPNGQNPDIQEPARLKTEKTFEDGLMEGRLQALSEVESNRENITKMLQELRGVSQQMETSHGRVVIAILRAALPSLAKRNALTEIRDFIVKTSAQALHGHVTLHAPPQLKKDLLMIMGTLTDHTEAQSANSGFSIEIDKKNPANKVCAIWQNGGGEIDIDAAVQECLALLESNYSGEQNGKSRTTK